MEATLRGRPKRWPRDIRKGLIIDLENKCIKVATLMRIKRVCKGFFLLGELCKMALVFIVLTVDFFAILFETRR